MTTFPALPPSSYELTPGAAAPELIATLTGGTVSSLADLVAVGGTLAITFEGVTEAQANSVRDHCRNQGGRAFQFSATTVPTGDTPVGFGWIHAVPPQVDDIRAVAGSEFYSVACAFRAIRLRQAIPPSFTARLDIVTVPALALQPTPSFTARLDITTTPAVLAPLWDPAADLRFEYPTSGASWTDQANGRVLSQAATNERPVVTASALNGFAALTFDGSNDIMTCANAGATGVSNCSIFLVMRYNASKEDIAAGLGLNFAHSNQVRALYRRPADYGGTGDSQGFTTWGNDIRDTSAAADSGGGFHVWAFVQNGATVTISRDGIASTYSLPGGDPSTLPGLFGPLINDGFFLGGIQSGSGYTYPSGGYFSPVSVVACLVQYQAVSATVRQKYEGLLAHDYWGRAGVAVPLSSSHPYYAAPPAG
jgi:hypothetical protein